MADNKKLARLLAGLPSRNPYDIPYQGLHNEPYPQQLPPFQMMTGAADPGATGAGAAPFNMVPPDVVQNTQPPAGMPPMQQPQPQPMPPLDGGGQGFGGPEPAPGSVPPQYDPNMDPRFLPEQWRGAYNNWQFPR